MEIIRNKCNTLPQQVEENRENIERLSALENPEGTEIKSTGETEGKVLTTDGNGGAEWEYITPYIMELSEGTIINRNDFDKLILNENNLINYSSENTDIYYRLYQHNINSQTGDIYIFKNDNLNSTVENNNVHIKAKYLYINERTLNWGTVEIDNDLSYYYDKKSFVLSINTATGTISDNDYNKLITNINNNIIEYTHTGENKTYIYRYGGTYTSNNVTYIFFDYKTTSNIDTDNIYITEAQIIINTTTKFYSFYIVERNLSSRYALKNNIQGSSIKSGNLPQGKVLTTDGNGGAEWEDIPPQTTNVINITTSTGTLSQEQYNILYSDENALICYTNNSGLKRYYRFTSRYSEVQSQSYMRLYKVITELEYNSPSVDIYQSYITVSELTLGYYVTNNNFSIPIGGSSTQSIIITSTSGTFTTEQYNSLISNDNNLIQYGTISPRFYIYSHSTVDSSNVVTRYYLNFADYINLQSNNIILTKHIITVNESTREYNLTNTTYNLGTYYKRSSDTNYLAVSATQGYLSGTQISEIIAFKKSFVDYVYDDAQSNRQNEMLIINKIDFGTNLVTFSNNNFKCEINIVTNYYEITNI